VVGLNPSARIRVARNSTLDRLNKWMDILGIQYYSFMNIIEYVSKTPNKNDINVVSIYSIKDYNKVLALGNTVSEVLNKLNIDHFKLPHPSPRNRLLNDKKFEVDIIRQCELYLNNGGK